MIERFLNIILLYFLIGAVLLAVISRKNSGNKNRENLIKYLTYFLIVSVLFFSILINPVLFRIVALIIVVVGMAEVLIAARKGNHAGRILISLLSFGVPGILFLLFSTLDQKILLTTVFVITTFDAFSQLTGQLLGRTKLLPAISPEKTVEGLVGGLLVASFSLLILKEYTGYTTNQSLLIGFLIAVAGFTGDMLESAGKRKLGIKDFGKSLPGHGGFPDRFDSLIFAGALIYLFHYFF
jgi:phosphatidate cytidylyltransferase